MERADVLVAIAGAVALGAAMGGVLWLQETADPVRYEESLVTLGTQQQDIDTQARFAWELPGRAIAANATAVVAFSGQGIAGGTATVEARLEGPDGQAATQTVAWSIPAGATEASVEIAVGLRWADVPAAGAEPDLVAPTDLLRLTITVALPADPLGSYALQATVQATATEYVR